MDTQVLVTYATKRGSTAEISQKIGEVLREAGLQTDVLPTNEVGDLASYQAVVLGSAVYIGGWRKEAKKFLTNYEQTLAEKPLWIFSSGPTGEGDPVELVEGWHYPKVLQEVIERVQPRETVVFHGNIDANKVNFIEKWMLKNVGAPVGDFRDWEIITAWAQGVAATLKEELAA